MQFSVTKDDEVIILEPDHSYEGTYGIVRGTPGDRDSFGDPIPKGWAEVQLDAYGNRELFKDQHLVDARLTL